MVYCLKLDIQTNRNQNPLEAMAIYTSVLWMHLISISASQLIHVAIDQIAGKTTQKKNEFHCVDN